MPIMYCYDWLSFRLSFRLSFLKMSVKLEFKDYG